MVPVVRNKPRAHEHITEVFDIIDIHTYTHAHPPTHTHTRARAHHTRTHTFDQLFIYRVMINVLSFISGSDKSAGMRTRTA